MEFAYKRLEEELLVDLQTVFKVTFKKYLSLEYIKRKYDNSLYGGKYLGFLAYNDEGEPIGFHGATFYQIELEGKTYTVAQGGDSMTDPRYQGKGLFTKLGKITQALAAEEGLLFVYGFPNQNSYPGYIKKLDWEFTGKMKCYTIRVTSLPFENVFRNIGLKKVYEIYASAVINKYASIDKVLPSTVIENGYGGVKRDERFYSYKQYSSNQVVDVFGCKVWLKVNGAILVGDIENKPEELKLEVLRVLKKLAFKLGVNKIIFQASPDTHIDQFLSKHYESIETFPIGFYNIKCPFGFDKLRFTYGDLDTF